MTTRRNDLRDGLSELAESMNPSADYSEWTLKLRANIKFPDGTPLDSAAVDAVLERQLKEPGRGE
jgi:peptide/nickel transport system substrate-binding protein